VDKVKSKQQLCHNWRKETVRKQPTMFEANDNMMATSAVEQCVRGLAANKEAAAPHFNGHVEEVN